nr:MAG TPA: hypothetical protein [Caudoviricetes sp.]
MHPQRKQDSLPVIRHKMQYCRSAESPQPSLLYHPAPLLLCFHYCFSKYKIQTLR